MEKVKLGIIGLNYDTEAGRGWPGARYAPDSIRKAMAGIMNRMEDGFLFDVNNNKLIDYNQFEIKDFGNVDNIARYNHERSLDEMTQEIDKIYAEGYIPIILGGDHSVSNASFRAMANAIDGQLGIIDLDAHLDIKFDSIAQGRYSGSSQIRRAIETDRFKATNIVEIGPRGYNYPEHYTFIKESGLTIITPMQVFEEGADKIADRALEIARNNTNGIFMTVDIDALDMAYALGSGGQEPAGLNHFQVSKIIRKCAPYLRGIDFVEVNPMTDHRELTSHVCANLILDYIAGVYDGIESLQNTL